MTLSRVEFLLLLDDLSYLEADLNECQTRLGWAQETPPECSDGGTWIKVGLGVVLGAIAVALL